MLNILLISDTHSYLDPKLLKHIEEADEVWHAGDIGNSDVTEAIKKIKPLKAVHGNIDDQDIRNEFPKNLILRGCESLYHAYMRTTN
jgi:putative phosphoesterase